MTRSLTIIGSVLFLIGGIGYGLHCLHPLLAIAYVCGILAYLGWVVWDVIRLKKRCNEEWK